MGLSISIPLSAVIETRGFFGFASFASLLGERSSLILSDFPGVFCVISSVGCDCENGATTLGGFCTVPAGPASAAFGAGFGITFVWSFVLWSTCP